jgi:hypothetical protein
MTNVIIQLANLSDTERFSELCFVTEDTIFSTSEFAVFWIPADWIKLLQEPLMAIPISILYIAYLSFYRL